MALSTKSLAGPGYIILNVIRVMNIIGLLAVIVASIVMLVKTSTASKVPIICRKLGCNRITDTPRSSSSSMPSAMSLQPSQAVSISHPPETLPCLTCAAFLLISELSLFRSYFARNWPLLSPAHGFVTLALSMIVLGLNILGNLNKPATSQASLGLGFWRIVIGSGVIVFVLGFFNLVAVSSSATCVYPVNPLTSHQSYVFRDSRQGITARQVRAHGAVAGLKSQMSSNITAAPVLPSLQTSPVTPTKSLNPFRFMSRGDRQSTLPSYHERSPGSESDISPVKEDPISPSSKYSRATDCTKKIIFGRSKNRDSVGPPLPINISAPMGVNPQFAHLVQRPDSALHPARTGESEPYRWRV